MSGNQPRSTLFVALQELSEIVPEMRAGQLMAAIGELCTDLHGRGLWEAADEEILEAIWKFRRDFEAAARTSQQEAAPTPADDGGGHIGSARHEDVAGSQFS
jgi:hypothetical protein